MSKKRVVAILLVVFLSCIALPAAADDQPSSSPWSVILDYLSEIFAPESGESAEQPPEEEDDDGLPNTIPVIDPNG